MDTQEAKQRYQQAGTLYQAQKFTEALALIEDLSRAYPENNDLLYARGLCLAGLGRADDAQAVCDQLAKYGDTRADELKARIKAQGSAEPVLRTAAEPAGRSKSVKRYAVVVGAVLVVSCVVGVTALLMRKGPPLKPDGEDVHQLTSSTVDDIAPASKSVPATGRDAREGASSGANSGDGTVSSSKVLMKPLVKGALYGPRWSPDGTFIACQAQDRGVVVLDSQSGETRYTFPGTDPQWHPISTAPCRVYYCRGDGIFTCKLTSPKPADVEHERICDGYMPYPSPDGEKLLFSPKKDRPGFNVFNLTNGTTTEISGASHSPLACWAPDGQRVAYHIPSAGPLPADRKGILIAPASGGAGDQWLAEAISAVWSPQGDRIACVRGDELCVASYPNGAIESISAQDPFTSVTWSGDGRWIAWARGGLDESTGAWRSHGIMAAEVGTKRHVKISDFGDNVDWASEGLVLALDGGGKGGIWIATLVAESAPVSSP